MPLGLSEGSPQPRPRRNRYRSSMYRVGLTIIGIGLAAALLVGMRRDLAVAQRSALPSGAISTPTASEDLTRQLAGLLHPVRELGLVELVVLVDVEVAHVLLLGLARRDRAQ